ncbi:Ics2p PWA37_000110 [Arxiozyma heterogenica]|uniref:Ics2p n=1 Tax=Arxiozyma heterogenica TaxID=278026 RepID=UPI002F0E7AE0
MDHFVDIKLLKTQQKNNQDKSTKSLKKFCFPDNFSTSSGPSVRSYLRNIYDDSLTPSSFSSSYSNNINTNTNNNKETEITTNNYNISLSTMDPEERKNLVDHLNKFSFEPFQNNPNNSNIITSRCSSSYKLEPKEIYHADKVNDQWESSSSRLSDSDWKANKNQFNEYSFFLNTYSINPPLRRNSVLPSSKPIKSNRRFSHKKTDAISLSQEFNINSYQTEPSNINNVDINLKGNQSNKIKSPRAQFERFNDIYIGDDDTYTNVTLLPSTTDPSLYTHHLSPIKTINNTREQIERNQNGNFESLDDFADFNNIDLEGRDFVSRPCTPKINLEGNTLSQ